MSALRVAHPGQPTRLVPEYDPFLGLTPRQRHILDVVRSFGGNRSRAARHLGICVAAVQASLRVSAAAGATVPPRITRKGIRNSVQHELTPRCGRVMRTGVCGRQAGHPHGCTETRAWRRERVA